MFLVLTMIVARRTLCTIIFARVIHLHDKHINCCHLLHSVRANKNTTPNHSNLRRPFRAQVALCSHVKQSSDDLCSVLTRSICARGRRSRREFATLHHLLHNSYIPCWQRQRRQHCVVSGCDDGGDEMFCLVHVFKYQTHINATIGTRLLRTLDM